MPRPTWEQTSRFAWFVAGAHSWYKHLPVDGKAPFSLFLDPHAAEDLVIAPTGELSMVAITDESTPFHSTWQTTETYRRRFGHWNCLSTHRKSFDFSCDGGIAGTESVGAKVLSEDGEWLPVDPGVREVGTAQISAFVHPISWEAHRREPGRLVESMGRRPVPSPPDLPGDYDPAPEALSPWIEVRLRRTIPEADDPLRR